MKLITGEWGLGGSVRSGLHSFDGAVVMLGLLLELDGSRRGSCGMSVAIWGVDVMDRD